MSLTTGGVLTVSRVLSVTGEKIDIEAYKLQFINAIKNHSDMVGGWDMEITLTENANLTATVKAILTFENLIDACYFAQMWPDDDGNIPDFCAVYLPVASTTSMYF